MTWMKKLSGATRKRFQEYDACILGKMEEKKRKRRAFAFEKHPMNLRFVLQTLYKPKLAPPINPLHIASF